MVAAGTAAHYQHKTDSGAPPSERPEGHVFLGEKKVIPLESPDLSVVGGNSLAGNSPLAVLSPRALGVLVGSSENAPFSENREITEYAVEPGDSVSSIAKKFGISANTILWANNLSKSSIIKPGQKLVILPVSGVVHYVKPGDTLTGLAKTYKTEMDEIIAFNGISDAGEIYIGDILIIPNGAPPRQAAPKKNYIPLAKNYFICPISSPCRITQGKHWYNAVDLSNRKCGEPVFAAAGGTVQKTGYQKIGGKFVRILHFNKAVTYYGHLSSYIVSPGQKVSQGQVIGYTGYTGFTIPRGKAGCHVHFDVRGAKNPLVK